MGLLPEFFTLLGIEIFAAMSLVSVLLDRDIPSSAQWLFQGAAGLGLGQLVVTEGFGTSSVIDASRFWISIFYKTFERIGKSTGPELSPASVHASVETPKTYESLDLTAILGEWEESQK